MKIKHISVLEQYLKENEVIKDEITIIDDRGLKLGTFKPPKLVKIELVKDFVRDKQRFLIPIYQRGYRWDKRQVEELLQDIIDWEGINYKYSLQPIILSKSTDKNIDYNIVDGQQRIVTTLLILKYLEVDFNIQIKYESKDKTTEYLKKLFKNFDTEEVPKDIDSKYLKEAADTIKKYFKKNKNEEKWENIFFDSDYGAFFIKYIVNSKDDSLVFERLNAGKIRLKNSELIKAMLFKKTNFESNETYKIEEVALEWDAFERELRDDDFWAWLGNDSYQNDDPRIDLLFELILDKNASKDEYKTFFEIKETVENGEKTLLEYWEEAKKCLMTLKGWYNDNILYHRIGYLIHQIKSSNIGLKEIYDEFKGEDKTSIGEDVKIMIKKIILKKETNSDIEYALKDLDYLDNRDELYNVLFLFNLELSIKHNNRFNFNEYSKNNYEIEHIHPQIEKVHEEDILNKPNYKDILKAIKKIEKDFTFKETKDSNKVVEYIESKYVNQKKVENIHGIGNLCLLDEKLNKSIKNNPFDIKSKEIIGNITDNKYILPGTIYVFLKGFSENKSNMELFTNEDSLSYQQKIIDILKDEHDGIFK